MILPALAVAACTTSGPGSPAVHAAAETITAADVYDRIAFLASDELKGRDTPSPGLDTAAQWIAQELASDGVEPGAGQGWLQHYPYPAVALDVTRTGLWVVAGATHTFTYGEDFFARPGGSPDEPVGVVYVGRTLDDITLAGGEALMVRLPGIPELGRRGLRFPREARTAISRTLDRAGEIGAAGVVFVLDPDFPQEDMESLARSEAEPFRVFGGLAADQRAPPALFVRHDAALRVFRMAGLNGPYVLASSASRPVALPGVRLELSAPYRQIDEARAPNVVGLVRGSDPELQGRYVVVTAHMDHVGVGQPDATGDSIYNGADDDASGTAVIMEVAEALASLETKPRRSVLLVAVSGEEKGLLGSRWFVENPPVPLDSMVANVNVDMVGRNAADSIVVIGQEYSSLGPLVTHLAQDNPELGLTVSEDLWPEERFFFRSDHFNFARREIPSLFFFAGTHEDYHRPSDEVDEIDTDKAARVGRLVFYLAYAIADAELPPEWDPEGLETVRDLTSR